MIRRGRPGSRGVRRAPPLGAWERPRQWVRRRIGQLKHSDAPHSVNVFPQRNTERCVRETFTWTCSKLRVDFYRNTTRDTVGEDPRWSPGALTPG